MRKAHTTARRGPAAVARGATPTATPTAATRAPRLAALSGALSALLLTAAPVPAQQVVGLPARDTPLGDRPATVYTVGAAEGESWEMFSGIRGLAFDAADNLYVLDAQNHRVVVLDPRGRFVRQFGRRGGGPGELQLPVAIAALRDGSIVVGDIGNRAFIVFGTNGEHLRNVPFSDQVGLAINVAPDLRTNALVARANRRLAEPGAAGTSSIVRIPLDGTSEPTTLFTIDAPPPRVLDQSAGSGANRRIVVNVEPVFSPRTSFAPLADGGVALQHESGYSVRILDAAGRHTRTLTRSYPQRKVTRRDQDAWRERQREAQASGRTQTIVMTQGGAATGADASPSSAAFNIEPTFAEVMSVVTNLRSDPQGRIWVQRRHQDGSDQGPIDLVDANGRYIGTLPAQQLPAAISSSGLASYVIRDELGVERVAVRRLPQSWR
jgi:hypothetical protein